MGIRQNSFAALTIVLCLAAGALIVPQPAWAGPFVVAVGGGLIFQDPLTGANGGTNIDAIGGPGDTSLTRDAALAGSVGGFPYNLYAFASADLGTGHLKIKAEALGAGAATANAQFGDRVYFSGPFNGCGAGTPGDPFTCYTVTFGMTVHGSFAGLSNPAPPFANFLAVNGFESSSLLFDLYSAAGTATQSMTINAYALTGYSIGIHARLNDIGIFAVNGYYDFSNTAAVTLDLPPGVTFTSDSGAFLQSAVQPVPEPGTLYLLGAGVAAFAFWRKQRGR